MAKTGAAVIDPYELLGVARDADEAAIKAAYRKVAKTAHPDAGGDTEAFAKISACYELLKDPVRRRVFDDTGYDPQLAEPTDLKGLMVLETRLLTNTWRLSWAKDCKLPTFPA